MSNQAQIDLLNRIRNSKSIELHPCPLLKTDFSLRNYQTVATAMMIGMEKFVLGDDCGTGKTPTFISAFGYLKQKNPERRALIVCNKSAQFQWVDEFRKFFATPLKINVIIASGRNPLTKAGREILYKRKDWDICVVTYDTFRNDFEFLDEAIETRPTILVLDEAQKIGNRQAQITKAVSKLTKKTERTYALTATIIRNKLEEAYSIFTALVPGIFDSYAVFEARYLKTVPIPVKRISRSGAPYTFNVNKVVGVKNLAHFRETILPHFIGRSKEEVCDDMPAVVTKDIRIEMEKDQYDLYRQAENGLVQLPTINFKVGSGPESESEDPEYRQIDNVLARLTLCMQFADSPAIKDYDKVSSVKEEELARLLEEDLEGEKTIVFTVFRTLIDRLCASLKAYKPLRITGAEDAEDREKAKQLFLNDPKHNLIFVNKAGSESINLQSAKNLIFYDLPWSYGTYTQIIGRAQRSFAKEKTIFVYHLMAANTVDEDVLTTLKGKKSLITQALPKGKDSLLEYDVDSDTLKEIVRTTRSRLKGKAGELHATL